MLERGTPPATRRRRPIRDTVAVHDDALQDRPLELLRQLLRFDTTNPPGNERDCIRWKPARATVARGGRDQPGANRPAVGVQARQQLGRGSHGARRCARDRRWLEFAQSAA
jgi:hypothetical protein